MDISAWLGAGTAIPSAERAALAWSRILDKPTVLTLRTAAGVNRAAQTLRVELDNRASLTSSAAGAAPQMNVILYGIRGHISLADNVIAEGDRCIIGGDSFRCTDIILTIGEIQGIFQSTG